MDLLEELEEQVAAAADWPIAGAGAGAALPREAPWSVERALAMVPSALREALASAGATAPGVLRGLCDGTHADAALLASSLLPGLPARENAVVVESILWLVQVAGPEAATRRRRFAHLEAGTIVQEVLEGAAAKQARQVLDQVEVEVRGAEAGWRPAVRPARFRLRADARLASASGPSARAEAEQLERERWKSELVALILEAGGPVVEATRHSSNQPQALAAAAGGRRARTLCKRVGAWKRVRAWCLDVYSVPFPRRVLHLVEYMQARADEPCGLSVLQGVAAGFAFMETCCGYPRGARLVDEPLFDAFQKEVVAGFSAPGLGQLKQAPRYPLALVLALEREVVDPAVPLCYRCHAWWHLVAVWASLRFDDHRGLAPCAVQFTPRGLEAVLSRTKTTGPGKRVTTLPMVVGYGAFLKQPDWLEVGWRLWQEAAPYVRDYFLVKPAASLEATTPTELSYEQASRLSRAVLAGLPRDGDVLREIAEPVVGLFTQHSARCWLASMAALLEVSEADLSYLGRWSPTTSKGYVRTATEVVIRVQEQVAVRLRRDLGGPVEEVAGERSAYLEMRRELLRRSFAEVDISDQLDALQAWTAQLASDPAALVEPQEPQAVLDFPPAEEPEEDADDADGSAEERRSEAEEYEAPPTPRADPEEASGAAPPLPLEATPAGVPATGYVVSLSKSDWRRLHRLGGCARLPGVHDLRFELLGDAKPSPEMYDDHCRQCWRAGGPEEETDDDESETEAEEDDAPLVFEVDPVIAQHSRIAKS